jgi:Fe-S-cluster containining protein
MIGSFQRICNLIEVEFARNRMLHGARIQCGPGCSDCCSQLFQITEVEAAVLSAGVRTLPETQQNQLQERASAYLEARARLVSEKGEQEAWGGLPPEGTRLACPALDGGICTVYEWRPLICRKYGIPLYNPDKPNRVFACERNFRAGEEINDGALIQIQTGMHTEAKGLQREWDRRGLHRDNRPLTVARAIMEDLRGWLPGEAAPPGQE